MDFRECGDCTACCDGHLIGNSYGNRFGEGKPCPFLLSGICAIYKDRPNTCRKYQCAWSQKILPEWMKPNLVGVMVSVEININTDNKQYLKVVEMKSLVEYSVYAELEKFCSENDTYYVKVPYESRNS